MSAAKSVVVGVDGSPTSAAALGWAVRQAQLTGSDVRAVTAWSYAPAFDPGWGKRTVQDIEQAHRRELAEFVDLARVPGVQIRAELTEGDPAEVLLAASRDADLLVLGRHGRGMVLRALLGSVSAKCLRAATCPVVILPAVTKGNAGEVLGALRDETGPII
ncbi:universal stress protein [Amycolatopsis pithecellobii]|uniref:Universal stress protein n=1 Tax=Amycolatopsis pithecellobii TaxID=664692 RepID=A0A6N7ZBW8_9PSEU|nr:universal stress protein [Amycolatopsis pithecellobii]MTD59195.1 universal stress protein [Amycolatopsis pithecellobii]